MYCPSFCLRPVDPVSLTDSLPARSTRDRDDTRTGPPPPAGGGGGGGGGGAGGWAGGGAGAPGGAPSRRRRTPLPLLPLLFPP